MLTVQFGNFSKRKNSTARPASLAASFSVLLKEKTSLDNPVFKLTAQTFDYNYCKWDDRYYFVVDIVSERNNGWSVTCELDLMATYRSAIRNTLAYVERAAGGNTTIPDDKVVPSSAVTVQRVNGSFDFVDTGHFNLAVVGLSGVNVYELTEAELQSTLTAISNWQSNLFVGATDIIDVMSTGLGQLVSSGSAMECIRSCVWVPFAKSGGSTLPLYLGLYDSGIASQIVTNPFYRKTVTFTVPFTRTGFLRMQPYSDVFLYLPFVGVVNVSHPALVNTEVLNVTMSRDNRTGRVAYMVLAGTTIIGTYGGDTGSEYPVGVSNVSASNLLSGIANAAVSASYGNVAGVAASAFASATPTVGAVGTIQGGAGAGLPLQGTLFLVERDVSGQPSNMDTSQGVPVYAQRRLGDITGYVQTRGASVSGTLHGEQFDRVNAMLDSGAFMD